MECLGLITDDDELDTGLGKEFNDLLERNLGGVFGHIPLTTALDAEPYPLGEFSPAATASNSLESTTNQYRFHPVPRSQRGRTGQLVLKVP
jgi:hypothetical protein